jgi:hypothetical protein
MSLSELCTAIGDQNRGANSKAVAELIQHGFLECVSSADRNHAKAREYRVTFISSGDGKVQSPATHEYRDWRPNCKTRKFGGAEIAPGKADLGAEIAPRVKKFGAEIAPVPTENRGFEEDTRGAKTAPLLYNHSPGQFSGSGKSESLPISPVKPRAADPPFVSSIGVDQDELRAWMRDVLMRKGYGAARELARDADVPDVAISRFRSGRNLPERYRVPLQTALGRSLRYDKWVASREAAE